MTDAERSKLSGIAAGATVAGACPSVFGGRQQLLHRLVTIHLLR